MATVNPYLNFSGNCEEAFEFYKSVFGGDFTGLSRFSDAPSDPSSPPADPNQIMHVALPIGDDQVLMGSDRPASMGSTTPGDNVQITVGADTTDEARRLFDGLAEGGQVTMPFERTFWGADFGMCVDRFGIPWMVNHDVNPDG
ncbi:MAG TPA: VOC family protein [Acidimicrobiia bacterium]|nr:VOC family protein [Acidimicrobiia bacterium]